VKLQFKGEDAEDVSKTDTAALWVLALSGQTKQRQTPSGCPSCKECCADEEQQKTEKQIDDGPAMAWRAARELTRADLSFKKAISFGVKALGSSQASLRFQCAPSALP